MRPVTKKQPGEKVVYYDAQGRQVEETIAESYRPYSKAKLPLMANLGHYCSYCEAYLPPVSMEVEHVAPKSQTGETYAWSNFLLACKTCNTRKGKTDVNPDDCHWPDKDNTYHDFVYTADGAVRINPSLEGKEHQRAQRLYDLVKLGGAPTRMDYRSRCRIEQWNTAEIYKAKLDAGKADVDTIIDLAKSRGYWSVWYTVFEGYADVRQRLITDFPGTRRI